MARSHELQIQIKKPLCEENTISQYTLQYMYMYVFMRVSVCVYVFVVITVEDMAFSKQWDIAIPCLRYQVPKQLVIQCTCKNTSNS